MNEAKRRRRDEEEKRRDNELPTAATNVLALGRKIMSRQIFPLGPI